MLEEGDHLLSIVALPLEGYVIGRFLRSLINDDILKLPRLVVFQDEVDHGHRVMHAGVLPHVLELVGTLFFLLLQGQIEVLRVTQGLVVRTLAVMRSLALLQGLHFLPGVHCVEISTCNDLWREYLVLLLTSMPNTSCFIVLLRDGSFNYYRVSGPLSLV